MSAPRRFAAAIAAFFLCSPSPAQDLDLATCLDEVRPRAEEERWRAIPWSTSVTDTLARAKAEHRAVFLFGYDGLLDTGNC